MTSPWSTGDGRAARQVQLRLLAEDRGFLGEFAREVVAGRADAHAILHEPIVPEEVLGALRAAADQWNALPEEQKYALTHEWEDNVRQTIDMLNQG
jgi:hypothetical protein